MDIHGSNVPSERFREKTHKKNGSGHPWAPKKSYLDGFYVGIRWGSNSLYPEAKLEDLSKSDWKIWSSPGYGYQDSSPQPNARVPDKAITIPSQKFQAGNEIPNHFSYQLKVFGLVIPILPAFFRGFNHHKTYPAMASLKPRPSHTARVKRMRQPVDNSATGTSNLNPVGHSCHSWHSWMFIILYFPWKKCS